jgi:hypothetical protein
MECKAVIEEINSKMVMTMQATLVGCQQKQLAWTTFECMDPVQTLSSTVCFAGPGSAWEHPWRFVHVTWFVHRCTPESKSALLCPRLVAELPAFGHAT